MAQHIAAFLLLLALVNKISGHELHGGHCPWIPAVPHFDAQKFVGNWYAVQKTPPIAPCVTYHVAGTGHDHEYILTEYSELAENKYMYKIGSALSIVFPEDPGKLQLKYHNSLLAYRYHVFATDYQHYAGVFVCQNFGLFHRSSIVLLSRGRTLDQHYLDEMFSKLKYYDISLEGLTIIDQHSCLKHDAAQTVQENESQQVHVDEELQLPQIERETQAPVFENESQGQQIESEVNDPVVEVSAPQAELEAVLPEVQAVPSEQPNEPVEHHASQGELEVSLPKLEPTSHSDEHHDHDHHHSDAHQEETPLVFEVHHHITSPEVSTDEIQEPEQPKSLVTEAPVLPEVVLVEQSPEQEQVVVSEGAGALPVGGSLDLSGAQSNIAETAGAIEAEQQQVALAGNQDTAVAHLEGTGVESSSHAEQTDLHIETTTKVEEGHDEPDCPHPSHSLEKKEQQTPTHQEALPTTTGKVEGEIIDPRGELEKTDSQVQGDEAQVEIGTFFPSEGEDGVQAVLQTDVKVPYSMQQSAGMNVEEPTAKISTRNVYFNVDATEGEKPDPYWDNQDAQLDFVETYATLLKLKSNDTSPTQVSGLGQVATSQFGEIQSFSPITPNKNPSSNEILPASGGRGRNRTREFGTHTESFATIPEQVSSEDGADFSDPNTNFESRFSIEPVSVRGSPTPKPVRTSGRSSGGPIIFPSEDEDNSNSIDNINSRFGGHNRRIQNRHTHHFRPGPSFGHGQGFSHGYGHGHGFGHGHGHDHGFGHGHSHGSDHVHGPNCGHGQHVPSYPHPPYGPGFPFPGQPGPNTPFPPQPPQTRPVQVGPQRPQVGPVQPNFPSSPQRPQVGPVRPNFPSSPQRPQVGPVQPNFPPSPQRPQVGPAQPGQNFPPSQQQPSVGPVQPASNPPFSPQQPQTGPVQPNSNSASLLDSVKPNSEGDPTLSIDPRIESRLIFF